MFRSLHFSVPLYYNRVFCFCQELFAIKKSPDFDFSGDFNNMSVAEAYVYSTAIVVAVVIMYFDIRRKRCGSVDYGHRL